MRVEWTQQALENLESHFDHVASENPQAARRIFTRIVDAVDKLGQFPAIGRVGRVADTRELYVSGTAYMVSYRVHRGTVEILRLLQTAQDWPEEL